jgi:hypothetical protein
MWRGSFLADASIGDNFLIMPEVLDDGMIDD